MVEWRWWSAPAKMPRQHTVWSPCRVPQKQMKPGWPWYLLPRSGRLEEEEEEEEEDTGARAHWPAMAHLRTLRHCSWLSV